MFSKYVIIIIYFLSVCQSAKILAIIPTPCYSHQVAYMGLWKELSLRGHQVTVITPDPIKDPKFVNLTEIDVKWTYKFFHDIGKMSDFMTMWNMWDSVMGALLGTAEAQLSYSPVQDLIHNRQHFDVVLVEFFFPEFLGFAEIYKCPKILISSMDISPSFHYAVGNPSHPILHPEMGTPFYGLLSFEERLESTLYNWYSSYYFTYKMIPKRQALLQKYFNVTQALEEMIYDIDMLFLNVNPVLQSVRAIGPSTVTIGGFRHSISPQPLSKDLKEFLDSAKDGFIYFSLGSNIKSKEVNVATLTAIIETLREVPYKVLWKFEADDLPGKPENVRLVKWAPQQSVLSHPNIKLFVTQGGLQSMEEGIYSEVPFVVIPFFGDQDQNAKLMENKGIGKIVGRRPYLKKEELKDAILEVISDPKYRTSVKRLKQLVLDTPMSGLDKAIWWTEYVIRHKGAKHLRNPAADLPFYQYYLLDVISFLIATTGVILYVIFTLLKVLHKLVLSKLVEQMIQKNKKSQ